MGHIISSQPSNEPDPVTGLTPKEKKLVQQSWALVQKDTLTNGVALFVLLFKKHPDYQNFFPFKGVPLDELRDDKKLKAHATSVMYSLTSIVDNLDDGELLVGLLTKVAKSHSRRNIPKTAFWDLKAVVLELLETGLGSKLSKDGTAAWDKTLEVAMKVIVDNM